MTPSPLLWPPLYTWRIARILRFSNGPFMHLYLHVSFAGLYNFEKGFWLADTQYGIICISKAEGALVDFVASLVT